MLYTESLKKKISRIPIWFWSVVLFLPIIIIGLLNFSDYGMSWDEPAQHEIGQVSYDYLTKGKDFSDFKNADYGVGFELPLIFIEKKLALQDISDVFKMRHLVSHLFFILCLYFGFWLIYNLFGSVWLAAVGVLLFVLNPVIYAHSFFNTKDIPFMSVYLVCFFLIYRGLKHYRLLDFVLSGLAIGFLVNLRIAGVLLLFVVLAFMLADFIVHRTNQKTKLKIVRSGVVFLFAFVAMLYSSWPYLYENPIGNFAYALYDMARFRWNGSVLYFGEMVKASELPWHYFLVWFGINTPIIYIVIGLTGTGMAIYQLLKKPRQIFHNDTRRHLMIYLVCLLAPILAVVTLKSVLYDGWRHLYFVYTPFVLLAVYGLSRIKQHRISYAVMPVLLLGFVFSAFFMVKNHPFQHVYFNQIVHNQEENKIRKSFDMDYWGVSYRRGIEEILQRDDSEKIDVEMANVSGKHNVLILPEKDRKRINLTNENPKYFITEYRWHPQDYPFDETQEIFSIQVENNTILSVFQLRE